MLRPIGLYIYKTKKNANCNVVNRFDHKFHNRTSTAKNLNNQFECSANWQLSKCYMKHKTNSYDSMHCHAVFTYELPDGYKERKLSKFILKFNYKKTS